MAITPPRFKVTNVLPSPLIVEETEITLFLMPGTINSMLVRMALNASLIADFGLSFTKSCPPLLTDPSKGSVPSTGAFDRFSISEIPVILSLTR